MTTALIAQADADSEKSLDCQFGFQVVTIGGVQAWQFSAHGSCSYLCSVRAIKVSTSEEVAQICHICRLWQVRLLAFEYFSPFREQLVSKQVIDLFLLHASYNGLNSNSRAVCDLLQASYRFVSAAFWCVDSQFLPKVLDLCTVNFCISIHSRPVMDLVHFLSDLGIWKSCKCGGINLVGDAPRVLPAVY